MEGREELKREIIKVIKDNHDNFRDVLISENNMDTEEGDRFLSDNIDFVVTKFMLDVQDFDSPIFEDILIAFGDWVESVDIQKAKAEHDAQMKPPVVQPPPSKPQPPPAKPPPPPKMQPSPPPRLQPEPQVSPRPHQQMQASKLDSRNRLAMPYMPRPPNNQRSPTPSRHSISSRATNATRPNQIQLSISTMQTNPRGQTRTLIQPTNERELDRGEKSKKFLAKLSECYDQPEKRHRLFQELKDDLQSF